jgi:hypothetical protein
VKIRRCSGKCCCSSFESCIDEQPRAIEVFEQQLNEMVALAVSVALARMGSQLSADDQRACRMGAVADVQLSFFLLSNDGPSHAIPKPSFWED